MEPSRTGEARGGGLAAGLRVVGLAALLTALLLRLDASAVSASWRGMSAGAAALVVAASLLSMALRLARWLLQVQRMALQGTRPGRVARGFLLGALLGAVTPLRLGEFYRVAAATAGEPTREARARAAAGVLLDKLHELLVVLATLAIGAVLSGMSLGTCLSVWAATLATAALTLAGPPGPVRRRLPALARAQGCLSAGDRARLLALTSAAHALNLAAGLAIYRAFGPLEVADYVVKIPVITLLNTAPVTVGGFGLRELAAMQLFGGASYPASAAAVAAAGLFFGANVLPALLLLPAAALRAAREERA